MAQRNGRTRVRVGVLEDERSNARVWLRWLDGERGWAEPEDTNFTTLAEAVDWIGSQPDASWLLTVDLDLGEGGVPDELENTREALESEDPLLARLEGAVLLRWLQESDLLGHVLVVTGIAYGSLQEWLDTLGVSYRMKPVRARHIVQALRELWSGLHREG